MEEKDTERQPRAALTRRSLITRAGVASGVFAAGPLIAACGGNDNSSSGSASSTTAGGDKTAAPAGKAASPEAKELRDLLGISAADAKKLDGQTLKYGAILPLSGPGAQYAVEEQNGVKLGIQQMQDYFGMKISYDPKDHKSGDPSAGAAAAREVGVDGAGSAINSYVGVFGATLPALGRYKILSLDPGGGTYPIFFGKDFFWGWRAITPHDALDGAYLYLKDKKPDAKRVALVSWDLGAPLLNSIKQAMTTATGKGGQQFVGTILVKIGQTDYSSTISQLKNLNPDVVHLTTYAVDPANFMKQFVSSGINAQVIGSEYTPAAVKVAGSAYDKYWAATDFFDFSKPPNPWSQYFIKTYQKFFNAPADVFYEPNYYECTIAYLEMARRVVLKGGDINKGDQMQAALVSQPTFKSVYGGDSSTVGTIVLDVKKHTPASRAVGLFSFSENGTKATQLASYNIAGRDFKALV